ncbi:hypothetical protein [Afifella pfennigii]|uniref:hypothetical protein n=1 Tax=Afifella pfennigii TaxID=209897 RepID=UPI00047AE2C8|nr:hypothetical protein [Afifella pfennigii]
MKLVPFAAAGLVALSALTFTAPAKAANVTLTLDARGPAIVADWRAPNRRGPNWRHDRDNRRFDRLSPQRVRHILRRQGITPIRFLDTRGRTYELAARGRRGAPLRVAVNAYTGEIVSLRRLGRPGRGGWGPGPRYR